ncbi:transposable element Tcb1 transposase [Trichonephila clavipes]|nr:transposable element Tcb1 transposase [Trichonephila clavipes]
MSSRHHIDDFMRGRIIGKIEEGRKITDVAKEFDIAHSVVSRLWKSFKTTGMCSRLHGGGRVRSTTPVEDRYIVLSAKKEQAQHSSAGGKSVSCCLRKADPPKNCCQTIEGRKTIRTQTCCVSPIDQTAPYCQFAMVSDDNATCHRILAVQDCLDSEGIQRLVWPAHSPDLNPIENMWDALGRQVAGRNYPPTNKNTLIRALTEEWDKLPQQLLDNVVQIMVRRVKCCLTLHGGHIPY